MLPTLKNACALARHDIEQLTNHEREIKALQRAVINAGTDAGRRVISEQQGLAFEKAIAVVHSIDPRSADSQIALLRAYIESADALVTMLEHVESMNLLTPLGRAQLQSNARKFDTNARELQISIQKSVDRNNEIINALRCALVAFAGRY